MNGFKYQTEINKEKEDAQQVKFFTQIFKYFTSFMGGNKKPGPLMITNEKMDEETHFSVRIVAADIVARFIMVAEKTHTLSKPF
jgi:hypothetical protein